MSLNNDWLVIADDTTGALDVGGSFFAKGYETSVVFSSQPFPSNLATVTVVDTNIRYRHETKAIEVLSDTIRHVINVSSPPRLFFKVDSTLRGHVLLTVDVVSSLFPEKYIFVAPAFPFAKRVCVDGIYYAEGMPILSTPYAQDTTFVYTSNRLANDRKEIEHVDWSTVRQDVSSIVSTVVSSGKKIFTFDTREQEDLETIFQAAMSLGAILFGSAGLAHAIPKTGHISQQCEIAAENPTLYIVGSMSGKSREQLVQLSDSGIQVHYLEIDQIGSVFVIDAVRELVRTSLISQRSIAVATPNVRISQRTILDLLDSTIAIATEVEDIEHHLVVVGGETARSVFNRRSIHQLYIRGELEPGLPIAAPTYNLNQAILTKAGGFGSSGTLVQIENFLRGI